MGVLSAVPIAEIKARGSINNVDVLKLRRNYYDDGLITADEAEIVFALNEACPVQDPAWGDWFVETLTDFVVDQVKPEGHLTSENAAWLIAHIAKDGRIKSNTGMSLLVSVLDRARWAPLSLVRFALDQVKDARPLRSDKPRARRVSEADVDLLRRILCSFDGDGDLPVTQPEAEILFDIDATTAGRENHPSWGDLFVKAIANCVLAASGYATPARKLALARDRWLDRRSHFALDRRAAGAGFGSKDLFGSYRLLSNGEHRPSHPAQDRNCYQRAAGDGGGQVARLPHCARRSAQFQHPRAPLRFQGWKPRASSLFAGAGGQGRGCALGTGGGQTKGSDP